MGYSREKIILTIGRYRTSRFFLFLFLLFPLSPPPVFANSKIVINEFVAHPASGTKEWVEFYTADKADLANYWLDDDTDFSNDSGSSPKKNLSGIAMGKDGSHPFIEVNAMFNNGGDKVVLFDPQGNIVDSYQYTQDPGNDIAIGRFPDATGNFQTLALATEGESNSEPLPLASPTTTPIPTPSNTPKPTHTPVPTKAPSPTKIPTTSYNSTRSSIATAVLIHPSPSSEETQPSINLSDIPTSVLGVSIATGSVSSLTKRSNKNVMIKSASSPRSALLNLALIIGSLSFIACGILVYLRIRGKSTI